MTRAARPCSTPGCWQLQPCPTHPPPAPWVNSRHNRDRQGSGWAEQARHKRILRRDGNRCYLCGATASEVDHRVARSAGGSDRDDNLAAICPPCHRAKTAREASAARQR